jgi:hypothetical protein
MKSYIVNEIRRGTSNVNGRALWTITMEDIETEKLWTTYIQTVMHNYNHWDKVITAYKTSDVLLEFEGNRHVKDSVKRIVNADCNPQISTFKKNSLFEEIQAAKKKLSQEKKQPITNNPNFDKLFDWGDEK